MSCVTTLPAPTIEFSPIVTPAIIMHPTLTTAPFLINTGFIVLGYPLFFKNTFAVGLIWAKIIEFELIVTLSSIVINSGCKRSINTYGEK